MYDDLIQRDQGRGQPRHLPLVALPAWLLAVIAFGTLALGVAVVYIAAAPGRAPQTALPAQPIVLLSGRDDHGLLAQPFVTLTDAPDSRRPVGRVHDGTFMRVLEQRGTWLRVQAITAPHVEGWVDDFYLRGRALRADGAGQVMFVDARLDGEQLEIAVRPIDQPDAAPIWIAAPLLHEVGAQLPQNPMLQR